jgi:hypothetical protein
MLFLPLLVLNFGYCCTNSQHFVISGLETPSKDVQIAYLLELTASLKHEIAYLLNPYRAKRRA